MLEIRQFLTLSTAHLTPKTRKLLDDIAADKVCNDHLVVYPKSEYGWFVYPYEYHKSNDMPNDLKQCLQVACNNQCTLICFDRDAEPDGLELPIYDDGD